MAIGTLQQLFPPIAAFGCIFMTIKNGNVYCEIRYQFVDLRLRDTDWCDETTSFFNVADDRRLIVWRHRACVNDPRNADHVSILRAQPICHARG